MIIFILFPGFGTTKKHWYFDYEGHKNHFIKDLSKYGKVYEFTPKWYNFNYYNKKIDKKIREKLWSSNIDFNKDDTDIKKYCEKIYDKINDKGNKYILIGHSYGSYFVYYFSEIYHSQCLFNILLDGASRIPYSENRDEYIKKYFMDIKENKLQKIINETKKYDQNALKKLEKFGDNAMLNQEPKNVKKIRVKTIQFRNLQYDKDINGLIDSSERIKDKINVDRILEKYNKNNYQSLTFINKTHFIHWNDNIRNLIISTIEYNLQMCS